MKKILLTVFITCVFFACDDRLEDLNKPTKQPTEVPAETVFANGVKEMAYMVTNSNTNINVLRLYAQYWAQTTYPDESQYNMVTRRNPDNFWRGAYRDALKDLDEARIITLETADALALPDEVVNNRLALVDICKVFIYSALVDAFGPIPFSEALNPDILQPKYDDDEEVYDQLFVMLDNAINMIDTDAEGFQASQDLLYEGDMEGWVKFANSLKLRMAITISDVNPGKASTLAAAAIAAGVFEGNEDNAGITYLDAFPNTHPVHEDLVQSGRDDYVIANTIVDKLNQLYDPRLLSFGQGVDVVYPLDANKKKRDTTIVDRGNMILYYAKTDQVVYKTTPFTLTVADTINEPQLFIGGVYGTNNTFAARSHIGEPFYQPTLEGLLLDYAEVEFLQAEAVERGLIGGDAEEHYNAGITASMEYWGVAEDDITDYLANPDVAYTTAAGDWKQKIGTQHWLALYNRGLEGWTVWRRLDFTGFKAPPLLTYADIPERFIYPIEEATLNKANLDVGIQMLGGADDANTHVFWDVN